MRKGPATIRCWHPLGEAVRVLVLAAAAIAVTQPFFTARFLGGVDARWYADMLKDFLDQVRSGRFPVFVGQGPLAWNGGIHPFRSAPAYLLIAGAWDLLTWRSLNVFALQHLTAITSALAGALGFYAAGAALAPRRRWEMMLLALLYLGSPAWLTIIYSADAYMTFMALGALPLVLYGNARSLLAPDGRGYGALATGLALTWMCHPPVALLATLNTLLLQGGAFLFGDNSPERRRGALRGAFLFGGLAAYYFVSMSGLPPRRESPLPDALQLAGAALVLAGLGQSVLRRRSAAWLAAPVLGGALLWFVCAPWFWWMAGTVLLVAAATAVCRGLGIDPERHAGPILLPALLLAAGAADAWLGPARPERNLASLGGLQDNAAHLAGFFLPVSSTINQVSDYQPGAGLWIVLAVLAAAFFRRRPLAVKLFFAASLWPVLVLVRVPHVSDFLAAYFPNYIAGIVNFPLVLRLAPVLTGFIAMGGAVWLAVSPLPGLLRRGGSLLLLGLAVVWCGRQAAGFVAHGHAIVDDRERTEAVVRPENAVLARFAYDLLPMPAYFSHGPTDPRLEFRLLGPDGQIRSDPDRTARLMEAAGASRLRLVASRDPMGPEWLGLSPGFTLAPGEHVLLRFEFDPVRNYSGQLILRSEHGYREYYLPDSGLPRAFGTGPDRSHVISLWNSGSAPEHYRLALVRRPGNDLSGAGGFFATMVVSHYEAGRSPVRVKSLDPLRVTAEADRPGWLETPRVFLPGYQARVDGRPAPVQGSAEHLAMVPLAAGRHEVELRYRGTRGLWAAAVASALTWTAWAVRAFRRRRPAAAERGWTQAGDDSAAAAKESPSLRRVRMGLTVAALALAAAAVMDFDFWTVRTSGAELFGSGQNQYYNQLAEGFRHGHLYMDAPVDPALLALPEKDVPGDAPYLLDASLYRGHYYLYFGVVPAVLVFWPYAALTGRELPEAAAALIFAWMAFGFATAWWLDVRRRCFPSLGGGWAAWGVLAIGLCSVVPSALRRPLFYEVAIAAGYAFSMAALWAATRARLRPERSGIWLAVAGVAAGLAVGSRASLAPAGLALLALGSLAAAWTRPGPARRRAFFSGLAAAALGLGAIGLGLAGYNYARFGNPLEFGHKYQLGTNPRQMFHADNLGHNLRIYYLSPPKVNGYFPFVAPAPAPPPPSDYIGREHAHGEWIWLPLVGLAAGTVVWSRRRLDRDWAWLLLLPGLLFALNFLLIGSAGIRANRYMLDFHPALVLATLVALAPALAGRGAWPALARWGCALGVAVAIVFNVFASMQVHGFFAITAPAEYARIAAAANRRIWPWLPGEAAAVGDRELEVHWPRPWATPGGGWEPILATGTPGFDDILWVRSDGGGRAQFIFEHGEYGSAFGEWFPLPASGLSRVRISGAFLLPGVGHPWYAPRSEAEQGLLKRHLEVWVDGEPRFDRDVPSYDSSPRLQQWGAWRGAEAAVGQRFSGTLKAIANLPVDGRRAQAIPLQQGALRLKLTLPQDRFGSSEPILQSGAADAFDTLAVKYVDRHTVQLVHDSLGAGAQWSAPFAVDYDRPQQVEIELPFAADGMRWGGGNPAPTRAIPQRLRVRWNGSDVFESGLALHPATAASIALGGSLLRSSLSRMMFAGSLVVSPRREPLGGVGAGILECRLPSLDPLGDERGVLARFERADGESAALVWERSAAGLRLGWADAETAEWSPPLPASAGPAALAIAISEPRLAEGLAETTDVVRYESVDVRLGPTLLLSASTDLFSNGRVQGSAILPACWSGTALASGSAPNARPAPPGLPGRVRIRFRLPPARALGGDPLLSAGRAGAADSIFLRQVEPGRYVIGVDHWGGGGDATVPLPLSGKDVHTLVIEMSSLFTAATLPPGTVRLVLDGHLVLSTRIALYPAGPGEVVVGRNPLGMSTSQPEFRGEIVSVRTRQP